MNNSLKLFRKKFLFREDIRDYFGKNDKQSGDTVSLKRYYISHS